MLLVLLKPAPLRADHRPQLHPLLHGAQPQTRGLHPLPGQQIKEQRLPGLLHLQVQRPQSQRHQLSNSFREQEARDESGSGARGVRDLQLQERACFLQKLCQLPQQPPNHQP